MIIKDAATGVTQNTIALLSLAHKPFTPSSTEFGPQESIIRFCGSLQTGHGHSTQDFPIQT